MGLLEGKVVLATGTSSGIGRASALRFAREGATVVAAARREDRGQALIAEIEAAGGKGLFVATDIASEESVDALFNTIEKKFGRLDCAFNNAAAEAGHVALPDATLETFDRIFATNVRGTWMCMRGEMQMMRKNGGGVILNVASAAVRKTYVNSSIYVASKHAVVGMTKAACLDGASIGVRVNCICPGSVRSEMLAGWIEEHLGGDESPLLPAIPAKRIAQPEEIASNAVWLLSNESSYINGAILLIDGGLTVP